MKKCVTILLVLLLLVSCGSKANDSIQKEVAVERPAESNHSVTDTKEEVVPSDGTSTSIADPEKLIKTGTFSLETRDFDKDNALLNQLITAHKGYIEESSIDGSPTYYNPNSTRTMYLSVRIPKEEFDGFSKDIKEKLSVISESSRSTSVAENYYDSENRIKVLEVQQTRLLELIEKAESLNDIFLLQQQLSDVEYELNTHKGNLAKLDDQIDYSTFSITLYELQVNEKPLVKNTFMDDLSRAFSRGISGFVRSIQNILLLCAENFLGLLLLIGIITGLFQLNKHRQKKVVKPQPLKPLQKEEDKPKE